MCLQHHCRGSAKRHKEHRFLLKKLSTTSFVSAFSAWRCLRVQGFKMGVTEVVSFLGVNKEKTRSSRRSWRDSFVFCVFSLLYRKSNGYLGTFGTSLMNSLSSRAALWLRFACDSFSAAAEVSFWRCEIQFSDLRTIFGKCGGAAAKQ